VRKTDCVVLASLNASKFQEWSALVQKLAPAWSLTPLEEKLHNPRLLDGVECFDTYLGNALAKARLVNRGCHEPTLADDSGLEMHALPGLLGVHSKRFQGTDEKNIKALLERMKGVEDRRARMQCVAVLVMEGISLVGEGTLEGTLLTEPKGTKGFGYDSVFQPIGMQATLAELSIDEKNQCSHRAKAFHHLLSQVQECRIQLVRP
jgi:XTP/dITP diphosphohydrolase